MSCCRGCGATRTLGVLDPLDARARAALLDAAEALGAHLDAVILAGAQAVYLHTGDADLAVAECTTDADSVISLVELAAAPLLDDLLKGSGFTPREHPGGWLSQHGVYADLMVPEALAGVGDSRRPARTRRKAGRPPRQGPDRDGTRMAVRAAGTGEDPATIAGSMTALVDDLRTSLG